MKPLPLVAALAVGASALWSVGWFVGKSVIVEPEADRAVENIRAGRLFFSYGERTIGGFPFGYDVAYHDVAVSDSSTSWKWTVPELHVATGVTDSGTLTLTTSPRSALELSTGATAGPPTVFQIDSTELAVHLTRDATGSANISAQAAEIAAVQKGAGGLITGGRFVLGGMMLEQQAASDVAGELTMNATSLEIAYRMSADGVTETWSESTSHDVVLRSVYDFSGYDPAAPFMFLTNGGALEVTMTAGSGEGRSGSTGGPSSPPFKAEFETGGATVRAAVGKGRLTYGGTAEGGRFDIAYEQGGPMPSMAFEMGDVAVDFSMPTDPSPDPQPYTLLIDVAGVQVDEALWSQIDPAAALPRDPMSMRLDFGGDARIFRDLMELQSANRGGPPIELETLTLRDTRLAALGASISVTGELDVRGVAARPDGNLTVVIDGALGLIDQLTSAGLIEPNAAEIYKNLGQQILRPGEGADQFIADVASDGGNISINGVPIGQ